MNKTLTLGILLAITTTVPAGIGLSQIADVCAADTPTIQNKTVRIQAVRQGHGFTLQVHVRRPGAEWRVVLAQIAAYKGSPWDQQTRNALEDIHANGINRCVVPIDPGAGYAPENLVHGEFQPNSGCWTGFNWGPGGALSASAYLELHFGSAWVDGQARRVVAIDGAAAKIVSWSGNQITMEVRSPLKDLAHGYGKGRQLLVRFGRLPEKTYAITINGNRYGALDRARLQAGVSVQLPEDLL
jgi:hypothetical protein